MPTVTIDNKSDVIFLRCRWRKFVDEPSTFVGVGDDVREVMDSSSPSSLALSESAEHFLLLLSPA